MEKIESVQQAVRAWRRDHRRGPLPVALRRRVAKLAVEVGEDETRRAVGVRLPIIRLWREKYGAEMQEGGARKPARFVELLPELAQETIPGSSRAGLRIEVTGPGGYLIRIDGARDAAEVAAIVRAAVRDRGGE